MRITLASAMGTCFGVEKAIEMALDSRFRDRLTIVGQLVHNPQIMERLRANGVRIVERDQIDQIATEAVMITAHGAADATRRDLEARGFTVYDASCPLVRRLHTEALKLQADGFFPVIVGQRNHVEVVGVVGNLGRCAVVGSIDDLDQLAGHERIGVVSQTTNRPEVVAALVEAMRALPQVVDVQYRDTICKPVKDRQKAIGDLLALDIDLAIVVGGHNSSNTRKLFDLLCDHGIESHHIEGPDELRPEWFAHRRHVGITAGTSTPQDVIAAVHAAIELVDDRNADYSTITAAKLIANNSLNAGIVLAPAGTGWENLDLARLKGDMLIDGRVAAAGTGADILGHPLNAVLWLANSLTARGRMLRKGDIVMCGSFVRTQFPSVGQTVTCRLESLGEATVRIE